MDRSKSEKKEHRKKRWNDQNIWIIINWYSIYWYSQMKYCKKIKWIKMDRSISNENRWIHNNIERVEMTLKLINETLREEMEEKREIINYHLFWFDGGILIFSLI